MTKVAIICTSPGMLRNGVSHPAQAIYEEDRWTAKQLAAFEADPAFTVVPMDDADDGEGDLSKSAEFRVAVAAEVKRQVDAKSAELQKSFNKNVADAVKEKTADLKTQLDAANARSAELEVKVKQSATGGGVGDASGSQE